VSEPAPEGHQAPGPHKLSESDVAQIVEYTAKLLKSKEVAAEDQVSPPPPPSADEARALLQERWESYNSEHKFVVGEFVVWKAGLRNRAQPEYGVPAIVAEVLDEPVSDPLKGLGSAYFREQLTVRLGVLDGEQRLNFFHYDGSRFELFQA
jgi:hypothetical protein